MSDYLFFVCAAVLSFAVTCILSKLFIPVLRKKKLGQTILEIGPAWHKCKEGTPTMGGLFFIGGLIASLLVFGIWAALTNRDVSLVIILIMMLLYAAIGFIDDYVKLVKKRNLGLTVLQKFVLQFAVAAAFLFALKLNNPTLSTAIRLPFVSEPIELGIFYWLFSMVFIVFIVNSVNLNDGIDGLCGSVTLVVMIFFALVTIKLGGAYTATRLVVIGGLLGGLAGFLVFNLHPAKVFMGDTGSLFLGAAVVGIAYWLDNPLLAAVAGLVYIIESVSVMLQVAVFKLTGGKRLFKMAPIHHHFEKCGWSENRVVITFTVFTAFFCILAYVSLCL
ncbi:MAG: phospho-N-acetylmuramoyl-pentapeptide-transferase [Firmicutes bacterium]|nr:phospho-N-acetylmuramoyl-pentapeptide-transferase [Bacillota bacterium]